MASHSDQTLALLRDASHEERAILTSVPYQPNRVVLHRDPALMPKRTRVWSSWNYLRSSQPTGAHGVAVSYWMNRLQGIDAGKPLFVTLNPTRSRRRTSPSANSAMTTRSSAPAPCWHRRS